jgi:hypothetical protein
LDCCDCRSLRVRRADRGDVGLYRA